ncbi:MAG TPA: endolytic transglycosylase MltG [Vicinamibacteria bacterium]|nr:endolytic transglycosylase MltG [Vicinamibacteria bacterium]
MRFVKAVFLLLVLAAVAIGTYAYHAVQLSREPYKGYPGSEVFFSVPRGASGTRVGSKLEDEGIIRDRRIFVAALRLRGETDRIQAGEYRFSGPVSMLEVIDRLIAGDVYTFPVTIPEGLTLKETAENLAAQNLGESGVFLELFDEASSISDLDPDAWNLEGYLFPTTYHFTRGVEPSEIARTLVAQFREVLDRKRRDRAAELGMTIRQVVTLASIVEKETGSAPERPIIASVFWNRLNRGMALASDPTLIYALKLEGRFDGNLRRSDLEMDSPYNSYRRTGLPPSPIASPGHASIDAVLEPAKSDYLYFVSKNDGTHHFSRTYREHQAAVREYQIDYFRRRRNGGGGS